MRFISRPVLVAVVAALLALTLAPLTARAEPGSAWLRQVYLSSDSPNVDLYVDGNKAWSDVKYRTISKYLNVVPGAHLYQVRPAGAAPDSPPSGQVQATLNADAYYTVMVAGKFENMQLRVYDDAAGPNPPPDHCMARFVHAALEVPRVDVIVNGSGALYQNISFMEASRYIQMPAGVYDIDLRMAGTQKVIFSVKAFNADGGHIHTLAAAGGIGRPVEVVEMYDSTSSAITPQGGAQTGEGGLFLRQLVPASLALITFALGALGLLFLARRQRLAQR
jgi:Domain of unknown function (DUF4397)